MLDRLQIAFDIQRRFVANASHELRTPLAIQHVVIQVKSAGVGTDEQSGQSSIQRRVLSWRYRGSVYGVKEGEYAKKMHIARVKSTSLTGTWEYFTGNGWSGSAAESRPVLDDVGAAYGVTKVGQFYTAIMVAPWNPEVYACFSCSPTGPFHNKTVVYRTPESGKDGIYHKGELYTYNIDVHDQLDTPNKAVITYNVNGKDFFDTSKNADLYRPRYLDLTFNTTDSHSEAV